jgi:CRISPR-associated protein Cmr2
LSIPELIKRLVTYQAVVTWIDQCNTQQPTQTAPPKIEFPRTFKDVNRFECDHWTAWFQGDGDSIGRYLQQLKESGGDEAKNLQTFSRAMLEWGRNDLIPSVQQAPSSKLSADPPTEMVKPSPKPKGLGRVVYAGGDDFFGVLFNDRTETAALTYLDWFQTFPGIWEKHRETLTTDAKLTVSVGWVWASPQVPQRDILQHCREAEKAAKKGGRDRLAIRILFAGGNWLEWTCPWQWLQPLFAGYRDREGLMGRAANWTHLYTDVATLEARHAFTCDQTIVAAELFKLYFPGVGDAIAPEQWWNRSAQHPAGPHTGILGDPVGKLVELGLRSPVPKTTSQTNDSNDSKASGESDSQAANQDDSKTSGESDSQAANQDGSKTSGEKAPEDDLSHEELKALNNHPKVIQAFNYWVIGLAHIGFHLHQKRPMRTSIHADASSTPTAATIP